MNSWYGLNVKNSLGSNTSTKMCNRFWWFKLILIHQLKCLNSSNAFASNWNYWLTTSIKGLDGLNSWYGLDGKIKKGLLHLLKYVIGFDDPNGI